MLVSDGIAVPKNVIAAFQKSAIFHGSQQRRVLVWFSKDSLDPSLQDNSCYQADFNVKEWTLTLKIVLETNQTLSGCNFWPYHDVVLFLESDSLASLQHLDSRPLFLNILLQV